MLINVIGWTTCRPFARHQRSRALFRDGTGMPGPPKDSAEAINACRSRLLSAVAWPKRAKTVARTTSRSAEVLREGSSIKSTGQRAPGSQSAHMSYIKDTGNVPSQEDFPA